MRKSGGTTNITFVIKELMVCSRALRNLLDGTDTSDYDSARYYEIREDLGDGE